jgi:hypothetical protein
MRTYHSLEYEQLINKEPSGQDQGATE